MLPVAGHALWHPEAKRQMQVGAHHETGVLSEQVLDRSSQPNNKDNDTCGGEREYVKD